ncbi:MAG: ribosomal protein S18-alanine N-acetyltransferase [Alphaproteobacteria bacterium]|nr:ribosomal protein S18-alanine N-acetyltransferase [Alphaproteobacteria bacterium]
MKIEELLFDCSDVVAEMHKSCFEKCWSSEQFSNLLKNPFNKIFIACDENKPLGFIMVQKIEDEAEIITVCVLPEYRKQGIAQKLIENITSNKVFLEVNIKNTPAINLYKKLGFKTERIRKKYYNNNDDALIMVKENK